MEPSQIKKNIKSELFNKLSSVDGIISVSIVGSFVDKDDLIGISDIDTIVICENLTKNIYDKCYEAVKKIDIVKCGLKDYSLKINPTFGPLKFDEKNLAVVHLMIYDKNGHKKHVISSPFTCYDWERSQNNIGYDLKSIYPVGKLQFRDFSEVRRSLDSYIKDLKKNVISYREYDFSEEPPIEVKKNMKLDSRHKGEFSYHIIKNLISNYLKLCLMNNKSYSIDEIKKEMVRLIPDSGHEHSSNFSIISELKSKRSIKFPDKVQEWVKSFLSDFQDRIFDEWKNAKKITFYRHLKTEMNDNSFLGQGRDPSIVKSLAENIKIISPELIFSSPSKRSIETSKLLCPSIRPIIDERLLEINYGLAEALNIESLNEKFPNMSIDWSKGLDPRFPGGENTSDVTKRIKLFLNDLKLKFKNDSISEVVVVTHNVTLRSLIGYLFDLPLHNLYRLNIPHGKPIEVLFFKNNFYPNISRNFLSTIMEDFA